MPSSPRGADTSIKESKDEMVVESGGETTQKKSSWRTMFRTSKATRISPIVSDVSSDGYADVKVKPPKWSLGILSDKETDEVPGELKRRP